MHCRRSSRRTDACVRFDASVPVQENAQASLAGPHRRCRTASRVLSRNQRSRQAILTPGARSGSRRDAEVRRPALRRDNLTLVKWKRLFSWQFTRHLTNRHLNCGLCHCRISIAPCSTRSIAERSKPGTRIAYISCTATTGEAKQSAKAFVAVQSSGSGIVPFAAQNDNGGRGGIGSIALR